MKHTILSEIEVTIERDQVIELRHGFKELWELGYVLSIFEILEKDENHHSRIALYVLVRVKDHADHAYPLANLKEDNGTLYFYCGERP
jgi:hypothetical protein